MPRIARGLVGGFIYHVINRGNFKQQVFHKKKDYSVFIKLMDEAKSRYRVEILAYCVMPNHFHMVLKPDHGDELSKYMQWLMTSHVRRYHRHYDSVGHIWQGRFKSFIIQEDSHLLTVLRYVEGNPVRAGLVVSAREWAWSSHGERTGCFVIRSLISEIPILLPENWSAFVDEPITAMELEKVRNSIERQAPYGSSGWRDNLSKELGLESTIRPRGRPKKVREGEK